MTRVLPLVDHGGNRRLISKWLDDQTAYDIIDIDEIADPLSVDFDICIIDGQAFNANRDTLQARREEAEPEFIPVLLLVPRKLEDRLTEDVWDIVDDIIWTSGDGRFDSLDTFEFKGRIRALLRARGMSRTLIDNQERLKVLHRVLRHNLRNSLNVILGTAQLIDDPDDNEEVKRIIETTRRLLQHADNARTIDNILEDPSGKQIELREALEQSVESYRAEYPQAEITLDIDAPITVSAIDGFTQVIEEVIENAIKHNPDEEPEVDISVASEEGRAIISVKDTGPPIPDPDQAILRSGLTPTALDHGSGLGLWLLVWTVRRSNGTVEYKRESDGNVIIIELPSLA